MSHEDVSDSRIPGLQFELLYPPDVPLLDEALGWQREANREKQDCLDRHATRERVADFPMHY